MIFNFNPFDELNETCVITLQLGDTVVQKATQPLIFAGQQFYQLIQQVTKDKRPLKVKCVKQDYIEDGQIIENSISFENKAFIEAFDEKKGE